MRFVSSYISDSLVGKVQAAAFMSVVLPSNAVAGQQNCGFATAYEGQFLVFIFQTLNPAWRAEARGFPENKSAELGGPADEV